MKVYSTQETTEILLVCKETVVREIRNNNIKAFKVGSEWRIHESRLMKFVDVVANNYKTKKKLILSKSLKHLRKKTTSLVAHEKH